MGSRGSPPGSTDLPVDSAARTSPPAGREAAQAHAHRGDREHGRPLHEALFERLAQREECELLVVSETPMERDRRWQPESHLPFEHVLLDSWTLDLAWLAVGSGFRTRFDTYIYVPKRPLRALADFAPDVVVAGGGGIWSSPANIAALAARRHHGWAFVPWWGSFTRPQPTWPRRLADPWVKYFMRRADACLRMANGMCATSSGWASTRPGRW